MSYPSVSLLHGPRVPTVGYWYGDRFLGEVRLFLPDGEDPKAALSRSYDLTERAADAWAKRAMLYSPLCRARRYD
ncbi:hypothetical protein QU487_06330 [Crenobacter sp. SG2305]|uniref:hypothetical protein n=1 Tax=Crenobacter oryzisoli TaxID=3056844 RepID=UPI0025AB5C1D|nr:hypothetical protein [Crenobacter sp. SG2305]MDN0082369.1 hypothetical protein [Crenobacter sp. SG2305]